MMYVGLAFESGEESLVADEFVVREAISSLFEITVLVHTTNDALDLGAIVGKSVAFRLGGSSEEARRFTGIVRSMRQTSAESAGVSKYVLTIVPALWLLTQRVNCRIFQYTSVIEIVETIFGEWGIAFEWNVDRERLPRLEMRMQYGESDFAFVSRLLEDAAIAYRFVDGGARGSTLIFADKPTSGERRQGGPVVFLADTSAQSEKPFVTAVELSQEVRPGTVTLRDVDFRRLSDTRVVGHASSKDNTASFEQYHFEPGGFAAIAETKKSDTPVADERGVVRADEKFAMVRAEQRLASLQRGSSLISFRTNCSGLAPGVIFSIAGHPRPDLAAPAELFVTELTMKGAQEQSFTAVGTAVFTDKPYAPERKTPKPKIQGVQSAIVVGPRNSSSHEEIHTDEFGRVRVQFAWDRVGTFDEKSSCWIRVSQGWAGGGYGMTALPRVGHEVLVEFVDGDPDQPIVVGRVHNGMLRLPYKLPENKAKSTWRSDSTPGSNGFNEIMFDDARGAELVYIQAERNLEKVVKGDESATIGGMSGKRVERNETIAIGTNRTATIGAVDSTWVGERHTVTMRQIEPAKISPTEINMVDGRISFTTGESTITLDGPNITLDAAAHILMKAGAEIALAAGSHVTVNARVNMTLKSGAQLVVQTDDGDVVIQGGPRVRINPEDLRWRRAGKKPLDLPVHPHPSVDFAAEMEEAEDHEFFDPDDSNWFQEKLLDNEWDFTSDGEEYRAFGCFLVAVVGKAAGLPEGSILRQAGLRKKERGEAKAEHGDPGNGLWGGVAPYGLDPSEMDAMQKGFTFFNEHQA